MTKQLAPWRVSHPLGIIADESLDGYVARVAAAQHFPNIGVITQLAGADPKRQQEARAKLPLPLADLAGGELLELALALVPVVNPQMKIRGPNGIQRQQEAPMHWVATLADTWPILCQWPSGPAKVISDHMNRICTRRGDGNHGASIRFLQNARKTDVPQAVRDVISDFGDQCRANMTMGVTVQEAVRRSGASAVALLKMRRAGNLPTLLGLDGDRPILLLSVEAIEQLAAKSRPRTRLLRASFGLGIPSYALRELVKLGFIDEAHPQPGRGTGFTVCSNSLQRFTERLRSRLTQVNWQLGTELPKVMFCIAGRPKPWAAVLGAIINNQISASLLQGDAPLAQRIVIGENAARLVLAMPDAGVMDWDKVEITQEDAAEIMNSGKPRMHQIFKALIAKHGIGENIFVADFVKLSNIYISNKEISKKLKINFAKVRHLIRRHQIEMPFTAIYMRADAEERISGLASKSNNLPDMSAVCRLSHNDISENRNCAPIPLLRMAPAVQSHSEMPPGGVHPIKSIEPCFRSW